MDTLEPSGVAWGMVKALLSSFKRPAAVSTLPAVTGQLECVVQVGHLAAYAQIGGFEVGQVAPLTYPQLLTMPLVMAYVGSRHCPWPAMGTVHLANAITQHQPVQVGDALRVQLQSGQLLAHDKGQAFTLELSIWRQRDGMLLWQAQQTLLRVGVSAPRGAPWLEDSEPTVLQHHANFEAPPDIGRRYARISQDYNPIHWSALSAKLLGFKSPMAHGLWTQARALALLHPQGVPQAATLTTLFKRPLRLPAQASVWAAKSSPQGSAFEVRDALGHHVHLKSQLSTHTS